MGYSNREKCDVMVAKFLDHNNNWTIYDGDRNENGKKAVFLSQHVNKTTTLHVYHAFFRLPPYQYNPSLGCFRKCHSLASHERQKQRYSSQSWPTFYDFNKLFNLLRNDRWDRRFVQKDKENSKEKWSGTGAPNGKLWEKDLKTITKRKREWAKRANPCAPR